MKNNLFDYATENWNRLIDSFDAAIQDDKTLLTMLK